MRVWDLSAGYLNRQSLLGEHRELHGLYNIVAQGKRGYSRHPETLRWAGALTGLASRHAQLAAEMRLRGYVDRTPLPGGDGPIVWPGTFVDDPGAQIVLLRGKYAGRERGRITLPRSALELWGQHKYSVMARDTEAYRSLGRAVARRRRGAPMDGLARDLVLAMRQRPPRARLIDALEHMWGHVRGAATAADRQAAGGAPAAMLQTIQALAARHRQRDLLASTALSELAVHLETA